MSYLPSSPLRRPWLLLPLVAALAVLACSREAPSDTAAPSVPEPAPVPAIEDAGVASGPDAPLPEAAFDEYGNPQMWAMAAQMGGALQALSEACGSDTGAGVDDMEPQARRDLEAMGADMRAFEAVWNQAHAQSRREIAAGSRTQLAEACEELRQMEAMAEQFGTEAPSH